MNWTFMMPSMFPHAFSRAKKRHRPPFNRTQEAERRVRQMTKLSERDEELIHLPEGDA